MSTALTSLVDHLNTTFTNSELMLIGESIGLAPNSRWDNYTIIDAIFARIRKNAIPVTDAELVNEFLWISGLVDDNGNPCDQYGIMEHGNTNVTEVQTIEEFMKLENLKSVPACYSFADGRDPACIACSLFHYCAEARIKALPPCFGINWNKGSECYACIEAPFCKEAVMKRNEVTAT